MHATSGVCIRANSGVYFCANSGVGICVLCANSGVGMRALRAHSGVGIPPHDHDDCVDNEYMDTHFCRCHLVIVVVDAVAIFKAKIR